MKDIRFEDAFTPVPPMVHARVENALQEVRDMSSKKAKPMVAIVLAAVLALGLIGAALAAAISGGVLDFMFWQNNAPEALHELVRPVGIVHESDGVTTTAVDTLFDGRNVNIGLSFDTKKLVYIVRDSITINGVDLWVETSNTEDMWVNHPLTREPFWGARGLSGSLDAEYMDLSAPGAQAAFDEATQRMQKEGKADVKLRLTLLEPIGELVSVDTYDEDSEAAWAQIDACVAAGNTPIDQDEPFSVLVSSAWLGDDYFEGIPAGQHPLGDAEAFVQYSNMRVLDSFELAFTLDADTSRNIDLTPGDSINDGRTHITFNEVSFTPLRSTFDFTITPDGMTMEEIEETFRWFTFFAVGEGGKATPLAFDDTFYMCDAGQEEQPDGTLALRVHYRKPALADIPPMIAIVPYNFDSSVEEPLWEYAIYIPGKE